MGQTVILNAGNYGSLVGGKNYKLGGYGFNYPVIENIYTVTTNIADQISRYIHLLLQHKA